MATFVQIEPDAFNSQFKEMGLGLSSDGRHDPTEIRVRRSALYHHVRRPVRGIQIKEDTYAIIQVRTADGTNIPLFDAAAEGNTGKGKLNSNFILQSIQETRAEKRQVILTFGEPYIFFFGEQPRVINATGILLNTEDFNWRAEWWQNYDLYLRGTQCVRQRARVYLQWDDIVVEGYIMEANAIDDPGNRNFVQFQFQMFLTNYQNISSIGDPNAHWEGKEIALDPNSIDLPGSGGTSSTALVRQQNITSEQLSAGQGSGSLLDFLRSGSIAQTATAVVELQGQIVDLLSLAGQFVSGRNIRVPVGFEGAAAFDQQVQFAVQSIPGASAIIDGTGNRTVTLQTGGLNLVPEFRAALGSKFGPARVGLPLSANVDEFITRVLLDADGADKFGNLFGGQLIDDLQAASKIKDAYTRFGIDTDPPSELTLLFQRAAFGIVISPIAGNVLANSSTLRSTLNIGGTLF